MSKQVAKSELAQILGVSERTLTHWQKEDGFPILYRGKRGEANQYDTTDVIQWWHNREMGRLIDGDGDESLDLNRERARLAKAQADRTELELRKRRGEVAEVGEFEQAWTTLLLNFRTRMLALPVRATPLVAACQALPEVQEELRKLVHEALTELSTGILAD